MWYIYTMEYYSAIKRNKTESFVQMQMDLESIMQSEVSQKEKNKYRTLTPTCGIQKNGTDETICKAGQRHRRREQTCGHGGGEREWDELGDWDWHIHTTMCKIDSQWEPAVQHRELSSLLCDDLDGWDGGGGGRSKREGIQVYIQLIHFIVQQKLTQHCKAILLQLKKGKM